MKSKLGMTALVVGLSITVFGKTASAMEEELTTTKITEPSVGQNQLIELDALVGAFSGLRAKGLFYSQVNFNLGLEAMAGMSAFGGAILSATYGVGVRSEFYLSTGKSHAWIIAPGINGYYVQASPFSSINPQDLNQAIGNAFGSAFFNVPTRIVLLSPNVEINWLYEFARHFAVIAGAKVGAATALNGSSPSGEPLAGKMTPDFGIHVGFRF